VGAPLRFVTWPTGQWFWRVTHGGAPRSSSASRNPHPKDQDGHKTFLVPQVVVPGHRFPGLTSPPPAVCCLRVRVGRLLRAVPGKAGLSEGC
jgi:hypothetical protein